MKQVVRSAVVLALVLLVWGPFVAAAEQPRLVLALSDQRPAADRISREDLRLSLQSSLGVAVDASTDDDAKGNASLGVLTVLITKRSAMLSWLLPDGRLEVREAAHGPTAKAILVITVSIALDMAEDMREREAVAEGELVDPYARRSRVRLPSPWQDSSPKSQRPRARPLFLDLIDPFSNRPLRKAHGIDTIDPWG